MKKYALFCIVGLLSACGFQLRGTDSANFAIHEIAIEARNRYGKTAFELRDALQKHGVKVSSAAFPTLVLTEEKQHAKTLGRGGTEQTAEIELTLNLSYQLLGRTRLLLTEDRLQVRRIYVKDDNNIAAANGEQEQLDAEMRRELIEQLLLRLQALTPAQLEARQRQAEQRQEQAEAERLLRATGGQVAPQ